MFELSKFFFFLVNNYLFSNKIQKTSYFRTYRTSFSLRFSPYNNKIQVKINNQVCLIKKKTDIPKLAFLCWKLKGKKKKKTETGKREVNCPYHQ